MLLMRPSVPTFASRLGAVFVTVSTNSPRLAARLAVGRSERQRRGSCHRVDEFGLGVERGVVDDRGDAGAVAFDDLDRLPARRSARPRHFPVDRPSRRLRARAPSRASTGRRARAHPVRPRERREEARQPRARRRARTPTSARGVTRRMPSRKASGTAAKHAKKTGEKESPARAETSSLRRPSTTRAKRAAPARDEHGPQRSPQRWRRSTPSPNHQHDRDERENDAGGRVEPIDSRDGPWGVRDQQGRSPGSRRTRGRESGRAAPSRAPAR